MDPWLGASQHTCHILVSIVLNPTKVRHRYFEETLNSIHVVNISLLVYSFTFFVHRTHFSSANAGITAKIRLRIRNIYLYAAYFVMSLKVDHALCCIWLSAARATTSNINQQKYAWNKSERKFTPIAEWLGIS